MAVKETALLLCGRNKGSLRLLEIEGEGAAFGYQCFLTRLSMEAFAASINKSGEQRRSGPACYCFLGILA
jgi:hypothetical protein